MAAANEIPFPRSIAILIRQQLPGVNWKKIESMNLHESQTRLFIGIRHECGAQDRRKYHVPSILYRFYFKREATVSESGISTDSF